MWVGAVAYNPKVVTIWEGTRRYFHDEAHLPVDVVLFQSYEAQVIALLLVGKARPTLVVCPTSVVGNWRHELARFAPHLNVMVHHGAGRASEDELPILQQAYRQYITQAMTTRPGLRRLIERLQQGR